MSFLWLVLVLVLMLPGGCGSARLEIPPALDTAPRLAVSGRLGWMNTRTLRFGEWTAGEVDRTWTRARDIRVVGFERNRRRQSFAFTLTGDGTSQLRVECEASLVVRGLNVVGPGFGLDDSSSLECDIGRLEDESTRPWRLHLADEGSRPMAGTLEGGDAKWDVTGTNQVAGGALPATVTTGYHVTRDGRAVAAVEVMSDGAVWLAPGDAAERALLAAVAAALLLAEDLRSPDG